MQEINRNKSEYLINLLNQLCFADPVWLTTLSEDSILMKFIQGVSPNPLKHDCNSQVKTRIHEFKSSCHEFLKLFGDSNFLVNQFYENHIRKYSKIEVSFFTKSTLFIVLQIM